MLDNTIYFFVSVMRYVLCGVGVMLTTAGLLSLGCALLAIFGFDIPGQLYHWLVGGVFYVLGGALAFFFQYMASERRYHGK